MQSDDNAREVRVSGKVRVLPSMTGKALETVA
jgi:hypothetical protein